MKGLFLIFGILIIVMIGSSIAIYFNYEKPIKNNEINYTNVFIIAIDNNNDYVITDYVFSLVSNPSEPYSNSYVNGTTQKYGYEEVKLPMNTTFYVYNVNIEEQQYYSNVQTIITKYYSPQRINLKLLNPGKLLITQRGEFGIDDKINLILSTDSIVKNLKFCIYWTKHILRIRTNEDYSSIPLDKELLDYDKCYDTHKSLDSSNNLIININYLEFGVINEKDYIDIMFYDSDPINNNRTSYKEKYRLKLEE